MTHVEATDWADMWVTVRHGMPRWPDNPPIALIGPSRPVSAEAAP